MLIDDGQSISFDSSKDNRFVQVTFDVIIGHELGGDCNYLQMGSGKFVTLDETGHGSLEFDLNDLAKNNTYMIFIIHIT